MFLHWEEKGWGKVKKLEADDPRNGKAFGYLPSQKQQGEATSEATGAQGRGLTHITLARSPRT